MTVKRYAIQNHPPRFWTGRRPNSEQVLAGPMLPNILVYLFDGEGRFLRREVTPLTNPLVWDAGTSRYIPRLGFMEELEVEVKAALGRLGVQESSVDVEVFFDDEQSVGIIDLPSDYSLFLEDPSHADDDEEAANFRESIAEWNSQGKFVLVWGAELWMDKQGRLIAS